MRAKNPLPKRMQNAPRLGEGLELFVEAFWELMTCRNGWGGGIPWTAIDTYCLRLGVEDEQREDLFAHLRAMERVYDTHQEKKRSNKGK